MSAVIEDFVVHQLRINAEQELVLVPRANCFDISAQIEELAQQLHHSYNAKPGKGVGGLNDEEHPEFAQLLAQLTAEQLDFHGFSIQIAELLKKTLMDFATPETGFVIFSRYQFLATDYLLVAVVNTKEHIEINHDLELTYSDHLDLARMQLAARVDLTELRINADKQRYVSFIKGRAGRKVSDFFLSFLGCQELVDIKQQNKQLVTTVDEFLAAEQLDPQEKQQSRKAVAEYYKEKLELGEDINIKELSGRLPSDENRTFYDFVKTDANESPLEEVFQADRGALKGLSKFTGAGGGVSISFDRALYGERIRYDIATDTLVIKGIPPNLKDQLLKQAKD
ncbi:nucleoid-associated protein YejK [Bowmanella sp. Y26]|uniref:Nucleoid-associated protein YejK n=1 Tax=Bowmanella yangjiangensis TaxID=2811230 RepID=A0ABS3CXD1_9ALTE|nr:nucleoid-associated protein YejK [Bowmanella yangjiangensis]MBN7821779.1 nucleoid-associated protein YejK [Bowmanella yangjiangensis]MBT1063462.1 nucleoid-associated protein YejK [Bowmanella yangjiangensis]